ncbi:hypothetical protein GIB67_031655 [Kingdonia uniflora]|uniref:ABC transporter domain-containing protein n=1 Tax=Kingdonia uniflora TaxID=39325 RepID=A0A7J7NKE6_9MAGN|nr:hypothetical protein GIB67_031655 [Kingdonia uniflora]
MLMKVLQAQSNSSKLATEAIINHRNIAVFSVGEKIMGLFEVTLKEPKKESQKQSWYAGRVIVVAGTMTSDLSKGTDAIKSVFSILVRNNKMDSDDLNGLKPEKINGEIELKEVNFCYPSKFKQMIFVGLSPKVQPMTNVALVGQSGSGKPTIIGLISRFCDPLSSKVIFALVSQEPMLFAGAILENIS